MAEVGLLESVKEEPVDAYRRDLLQLAFQGVTAMPAFPHIKDRSRAQEKIVEAALELGLPHLALGFAEEIGNWRRGAAYAAFAHYCAEHGHTRGLEPYLEPSIQIAIEDQKEDGQGWRIDRVRAKVAQTYALLGKAERLAQATEGLDPSSASAVAVIEASQVDRETFDAQIAQVHETILAGDFEMVRAALQSCIALFDRFYDQAELRDRAEEAILESWGKIPAQAHIETVIELALVALEKGDHGKVIELARAARGMFDEKTWPIDSEIPLKARLAGLHAAAGDKGTAHDELTRLLGFYEEQREKVYDVFRAALLRPIAEAYVELGDPGLALAVYKRAVDEGAHNPNSRPNSMDLAETCTSMALHGIEPDEQLWKRMREIEGEFSDPW